MSTAQGTDTQPVGIPVTTPRALAPFWAWRSRPGSDRVRPSWRRSGLLLAILAAALGARVWDIRAGLPAIFHPDEPTELQVIERIVATGDLDPHAFDHPSLFFYLQAAVSLDGPLLGWLIPGDRAVPPVPTGPVSAYAPSIATVLVHRGLSVACGVVLVAVVWCLARRAFATRLVPAVAAGLVAFSPTLVEHSRIVTPEVLAGLLVALVALAALHVLDTGSTRAHLGAGVLVGLAASADYAAALSAVAVVVASGIRLVRERDRRSLWRLAAAGAVSGAAFLATTPYALLDRAAFLTGLRSAVLPGRGARVGLSDLAGAVAGLLRAEFAILLPAVVGIGLVLAAGCRGGRERAAVLLAFPLLYAAVLLARPVRDDGAVVLVLPVLAVFAGIAVRRGAAWLLDRVPRSGRRSVVAGLAGLLVAAAGAGLVTASPSGPVGGAASSAGGQAEEVRTRAAAWIEENVPAGSDIVVEGSAVVLDPSRYHVTVLPSLIDGALPSGTDLVVASEPTADRDARSQLFDALVLRTEVPNGENSVLIFSVPADYVAP